jgi:hypothetical protein
MALLYTEVCKASGVDPNHPGVMPIGCPTGSQLLPGDLARIVAWIAAGAPNN